MASRMTSVQHEQPFPSKDTHDHELFNVRDSSDNTQIQNNHADTGDSLGNAIAQNV